MRGQDRMVFIQNQQRIIHLNKKSIKKRAGSILKHLGKADHELSILFLDNKGITEINKRYLGRNRPTNVISFSLQEGEFGEVNPQILGDVVISVEEAQEQAEAKGTLLEEEITFLLIHGILHLSGYDHEGKRDERKRMREKEKELFQLMNKMQ
jgi:probable rRNA maturation factor